jgi:hypothetical protein
VALYDRCLKRWGKLHGFIAFIDTDEFIVLRDGTPNLPTLVRACAWLLLWGAGMYVLQVWCLVVLDRRWRLWAWAGISGGS